MSNKSTSNSNIYKVHRLPSPCGTYLNEKNYVTFIKTFTKYMRKTYGQPIIDILEGKDYAPGCTLLKPEDPRFEKLSKEEKTLVLENLNREALKSYSRKLNDWEENRIKAFADVLFCLSEESEFKITSDKRYKKCFELNDVLGLINILKETHQLGNYYSNPATLRTDLLNALVKHVKVKNMSLDVYHNQFIQIVEQLDNLSVDGQVKPYGSKSDLAYQFLLGLSNDPDYYDHFVEQRSWVDNKVKPDYADVVIQLELATNHYLKRVKSDNLKPSGGASYGLMNDNKKSESKKKKNNKSKKLHLQVAALQKKLDEFENSASKNIKHVPESEIICLRCCKTGHKSNKCLGEKASDAEQEAAKKAYDAKQGEKRNRTGTASAVLSENEPFPTSKFLLDSNTKSCCGTIIPNKIEILIDGGSEISIFKTGILSDVVTIPTFYVRGVFGDSVAINRQGYVSWYSKPILESELTNMNILCLRDVKVNCKITETDDNIIMHTHEGDINFKRRDKIFVAYLDKSDFKTVSMLTVEDKLHALNKSQFEQVQLAKDLFAALSYPPPSEVKRLIKSGNITGANFSDDIIDLVSHIHGELPMRIKAKNKRRDTKRFPPISSLVYDKVPLVGYTDIMEIRKQHFLLTVYKPLNLTMVSDLASLKVEDICKAVVEQVSDIRSHQFSVIRLHADHGPQMVALKKYIQDFIPYIVIDVSAGGDYIPVCDRKMSIIKESLRSRFPSYAYSVPNSWIGEILRSSVSIENIIRTAEGSQLSARTAFTGMIADARKYLGLVSGDYCEVPRDNQSSNDCFRSRTISAIALRAVNNVTQSWRFINLETGRIIERSQWRKCKITDAIVKIINDLHDAELKPQKTKPSVTIEVVDDESAPAKVEPNVPTDVSTIPTATPSASPAVSTDVIAPISNIGVQDIVNNNTSVSTDAVVCSLNLSTPIVDDLWVAHISYKKGLELFGEIATKACENEISSIIIKDVVKYVHSVPKDATLLRSFMFLKQKIDSDGDNTVVKSRLTANGSTQPKLYDDNFSPVLKGESLKMIIVLAASNNYKLCSADIGTAYLNANMDSNVYIRVDKEIASIFVKIDPNSADFLQSDGSLFMKLQKALYGCRSSAKLWNDEITKFLLSIGFVQNEMDRCVFNRVMKCGGKLTVGIVVDDFIISYPNVAARSWLLDNLRGKYKQVKSQIGDTIDFIGFKIVRDNEFNYKLSMVGFSKDVIKSCFGDNDVKCKISPATDRLFDIDFSLPLLSPSLQEWYHTVVAKLLYLSNHLRPDLSLAVSFLVTRVNKANDIDVQKLFRVCEYLNDTIDMCIKICKSSVSAPRLESYIDAGFGNHADGKSHTGMIVKLNGNTISWKSVKQKIVSKDSTEAELIALSDRVRDVVWCKDFLIAQGVDVESAVTTYQDNTSTMHLVSAVGKEHRTKHLRVRQNLVKELELIGEIKIKHLPTIDMLADMLTKPLSGVKFREMVQAVMGDDNYRDKSVGVRCDSNAFAAVFIAGFDLQSSV